MKQQESLKVKIYRGDVVESVHLVDAIVVNQMGQTLASYGEAGRKMYPRSAVKMIQAISFVESGAIEKWSLANKHISIACASHYGEKIHTAVIEDWLKRLKQNDDVFECGAHIPYDDNSAHELIRSGLQPLRMHNNCSGKHCGMISTALAMGVSPKGYSSYDHPVQTAIRKISSELSGYDYSKTKWGIDGCGIPTYFVPMKSIAQMMTYLLSQDKSKTSQKIIEAIFAEPLMISGTQGLCSQIATRLKGSVLAKGGAEGVYTAVDLKQNLSFVLKVHDGASRAAEAAILWLLKDFGAISEVEYKALELYSSHIIKNWAGTEVGQIKVDSE